MMLKLLFRKKTPNQLNPNPKIKQKTWEANNIPYVKMSQSQLERALTTLGPFTPVCQLHLLAGTCVYSLNGK